MLRGQVCRCHVIDCYHSTSSFMITDCDSRYYLVVWRRPKFFLFNYIQPAVLINIIALFVFLIPAESGEKVTL